MRSRRVDKRLVEVIPGIYYGLRATNQRCSRCSGSIVEDAEGDRYCLLCLRPWHGKQESELERVQRRGLR